MKIEYNLVDPQAQKGAARSWHSGNLSLVWGNGKNNFIIYIYIYIFVQNTRSTIK